MAASSRRTPAFARRRLPALAGALLALSVGTAALPDVALAKGPESLADLAAQVTDAVVNISASTTVEARGRTLPQLPQGTPFEDLFEEFFNRRGQGGGESQPRAPRRSNSLGSGFIIDASGIVVTNNHVIGDANDIQVILHDGRKLKAEIIGKDSKIDLAVLRVKPDPDRPLKAVPLGIPLFGILIGHRYTYQWSSMFVLLYFMEGVMRAWGEDAEAMARRARRLRRTARRAFTKAARSGSSWASTRAAPMTFTRASRRATCRNICRASPPSS